MSDALVEAVTRYTEAQAGESPFVTAVEGLTLLRSDRRKWPTHLIFKPALRIVVQGAKWTMFGGKRFDYGAGQALVVSLEVPGFSRAAEASADKPYLSLVIEFDLAVMREVLEGLKAPPKPSGDVGSGVFVMDLDGPLADCALRAVRLLETPEAIPALYPLIMREMCYRLLAGPHGGEVARVALANGQAQQVIRAIHTLRSRFTETVRIEDLATTAKMSPSQFSREYSRMFGAPARRDIVGLRTRVRPQRERKRVTRIASPFR